MIIIYSLDKLIEREHSLNVVLQNDSWPELDSLLCEIQGLENVLQPIILTLAH